MNTKNIKQYISNNEVKFNSVKIKKYGSNSTTAIIINNINNVIEAYFNMVGKKNNCKYIISVPTYKITEDIIEIEVIFYCTGEINNKYLNDVSISSIISKIVNKDVHMKLIRVHYPYINSIIFAKFLSHNSNFSNYLAYQDSMALNINYISNPLPSNIAGIKVIISGRIPTQRIIPRVTTKTFSFGTFKGNNIVIDYNKYTAINQRGTFTFKVWISQRI